jgi:hypothetical protein
MIHNKILENVVEHKIEIGQINKKLKNCQIIKLIKINGVMAEIYKYQKEIKTKKLICIL